MTRPYSVFEALKTYMNIQLNNSCKIYCELNKLFYFKDERVKSGTYKISRSNRDGGEPEFVLDGDGDALINEEEIADELKYEKLCAIGDCSSMPAKQRMQIRVIISTTIIC